MHQTQLSLKGRLLVCGSHGGVSFEILFFLVIRSLELIASRGELPLFFSKGLRSHVQASHKEQTTEAKG